ncbi:MAG: FAD-dependent oxidoreductase [Planctomycetota bacterium]|nr:FAD-dependent oxidoreductase [Planctomycetota bacterium]
MESLTLTNASIWRHTLSPADLGELERDDGLALTNPDVLIVGGGIVGLATAYFIATQKKTVQLIEANTLGSGATAAAAGGIWPSDQGPHHPPAFQPLALRSRDLWGRLSLKPDFDIDWRVNGFLTVNPDRFRNDAVTFAHEAQEAGYTVHAVDAEQITHLEPQLRPGLTAGIHCASDAHSNPLKGAASFARGSRRLGAKFAVQTEFVSSKRVGARVVEVQTSRGLCYPGQVVICSGALAPVPPHFVRPVSGQMIATGPLPPLLRGTVGGKFLTLQLKSGEIITGGTLAENNRQEPDATLSYQMAQAARELIPAIKDVPFTRAWCGIRSATRDGLPIVDRVPDCDNLWISTGHFRNGLLLAPATGQLLADWIATGERSEELEPLNSARVS